MKQYGKTKKEIEATEIETCREIVQEILNYGVNQNQLLTISYLLTLELENAKYMAEISKFLKEYLVPVTDNEKKTSNNSQLLLEY